MESKACVFKAIFTLYRIAVSCWRGKLSCISAFGELNPNPHYWIFTSFSVDFSLLSYLLLPPRSEYRSHCTKVWPRNKQICDASLSTSAQRSFARSVADIAPKSPFLCTWLVWAGVLCGMKNCQVKCKPFPKIRNLVLCMFKLGKTGPVWSRFSLKPFKIIFRRTFGFI